MPLSEEWQQNRRHGNGDDLTAGQPHYAAEHCFALLVFKVRPELAATVRARFFAGRRLRRLLSA